MTLCMLIRIRIATVCCLGYSLKQAAGGSHSIFKPTVTIDSYPECNKQRYSDTNVGVKSREYVEGTGCGLYNVIAHNVYYVK